MSEFKSVEEYTLFVLDQVFKYDAAELERSFGKEEETKLKERLKVLGYLD